MPPPVDDLWKAYHEAGHAVAAHSLGGMIHRVSIVSTERYEGVCEFHLTRVFQSYSAHPVINQLTCQIVISLAGPAAQARFAPESCEPEHPQDDHLNAREFMVPLAGLLGHSLPDFTHYESLADRFVSAPENEVAIEALAEALCRCRRLSGTKAAGIIDEVWKEYYQ